MTITFHIFNQIDSKYIMNIIMPWDYRKAINGYYSNLWRSFKVSCASSSKLDKRFVRLKIRRDRINTSRLVINFPSGIRLDSPFDLTPIDFKIINLHLQAIELTLDFVTVRELKEVKRWETHLKTKS